MKSHLLMASLACGLFGLTPASADAANGSAAADLTRSYIKARDARDGTAGADCCMLANAAPTPAAGAPSEPSSCGRVRDRSAVAPELAVARRDGSCRSPASRCADGNAASTP